MVSLPACVAMPHAHSCGILLLVQQSNKRPRSSHFAVAASLPTCIIMLVIYRRLRLSHSCGIMICIYKTGQVERGYRRVRAPVNTSRGNVPYVILAQNL
jgi:hypothetical protein